MAEQQANPQVPVPAWQGPLPHVVFFMRSEVTLFFEAASVDPKNFEGESAASANKELLDALAKVPIPVHPSDAFTGHDGNTRTPLVLRQNGVPYGVMQTVNLSSWVPETERQQLGEAAKQGARTGQPQPTDPFATLAVGYQQVADVLKTLHDYQGRTSDGIPWQGLQITEMAPNWLHSVACGVVGPGPGGRPVPTRPTFNATRPLRFRQPPDLHLPADLQPPLRPDGHGEGILVAIFDTWPATLHPFNPMSRIDNHASVEALRNPGAGGGATANRFLAEFAEGNRAKPPVIPTARIANSIGEKLDGGILLYPFGRGTGTVPETPYNLSDHGLFVASIIHDIAPRAEISLYRVITNEGVGDGETVMRAVQAAIDDAHRQNKRLVLNLSLGAEPNPLFIAEYMSDVLGYYSNPAKLWGYVQGLNPGVTEVNATPALDDLIHNELVKEVVEATGRKTYKFTSHLGVLEKAFRRNESADVLMIASSGNDSVTENLFTPKLPAAVEGVLAISAVAFDARGTITDAGYSNTDDLFPDNAGLKAFGGAVQASYTEAGDALVGLYTWKELPPGTTLAGTATTGWAEWSGTSFAAPIAAGVAACIWSAHPRLPSAVIRQDLQDLANANGGALPYIQR